MKRFASIILTTAVMCIISCFLTCSGKNQKEKPSLIKKEYNKINNLIFVKGMNGAENIYLENDSQKFYATDCSGTVYLIDGETREDLKIIKQKKLGDEYKYCLGIDKGPDNFMYVGASGKNWLKKGGAIFKMNMNLENAKKVTDYYVGMNGLCIDKKSNIYFASGNMNLINDKGKIYKMNKNQKGGYDSPEILIDNLGTANGLFYDKKNDLLFYTEVFKGASVFNLNTLKKVFLFGRTKLVEGFDDLCVDKMGNVWVGDQPDGFIKKYDPVNNTVTKYKIAGMGVASSCRIRVENGEEIIYIAEIKQPGSKKYDGRGVMSFPIKEL